MPDLATVLAGLFGGSNMTVFQATVDAVGEGVVTIHANGGTFEDVPYMQAGFYPALGPGVGDPCYVLGREGWGMLCLGKPAAGPERSAGDAQTVLWTPYTRATYSQTAFTWNVPGTATLPIEPGNRMAVYFLRLSDLAWPSGGALATASFYLEAGPFDTTGAGGVDNAYVELGLVSNASPTGVLSRLADATAMVRLNANMVNSQYISIPLDWGTKLLSGAAKGIYVSADSYPGTAGGAGTVRLTTL